MNKVILSLAILGFSGMIQGQNSFQVEPAYASIDEIEVGTASDVLNSLPDSESSIFIEETSVNEYSSLDDNMDYLTEVQGPAAPLAVRKYQIMASLYDVSETYVFDGRNEPFQMVFKTEKGIIRTTYNWKGEVLTSEENFRDVALPNKMMRSVLKNHEGWKVVSTNYNVSYVKDRQAKKIYTLHITDGKKKKKISMIAEGGVL